MKHIAQIKIVTRVEMSKNSERIQKIIFITVDFIKSRVYNQKNKAVSADEDYKFCCF